MNDVIQYERDFVVKTKTHHQTPIVHSSSIIAGSSKDEKATASRSHSRHSSMDHSASTKARAKRLSMKHVRDAAQDDAVISAMCDSESSLSAGMSHHCFVMPLIFCGLLNAAEFWKVQYGSVLSQNYRHV